MSGGSYDYLCWKGSHELVAMQEQIERMANRLAALGYAQDAAREMFELLLVIRQSSTHIDCIAERLSDIMHAVEWWECGDSSEEDLRLALERYRNPKHGKD